MTSPRKAKAATFWIGTSGFQYPEWKGKFYPQKMSPAKMLPYYAEQFKSTEINYTFRSIPSEKTMLNWSALTPDDFRFSFKAPQRVTHFAKLRGCGETLGIFHVAIGRAGKKMGPVLFQLPPYFKKDVEVLRDFLAELQATEKGMKAAFEFRHESWFEDSVFETLAKGNAALCIAESEDLATPPVATADFGYLRPRREDYTKKQIEKWAGFVRDQRWNETFAYFKHEERALGVGFARQFGVSVQGER